MIPLRRRLLLVSSSMCEATPSQKMAYTLVVFSDVASVCMIIRG